MDIRLATTADATLIAAHRRAMFDDMGSASEPTLIAMEQASMPWTEHMIAAGKYLGGLRKTQASPSPPLAC